MLEPEELKRRIEAARILRGLRQVDLSPLLEADGLGKTDLGRIERGEVPMRRIHRDALARHLRVPEWWFTVEDVDVLVGLQPPPRLTPEEGRDLLGRLLTGLDLDADQGPQGTQRQQDDDDRPSADEEDGSA